MTVFWYDKQGYEQYLDFPEGSTYHIEQGILRIYANSRDAAVFFDWHRIIIG